MLDRGGDPSFQVTAIVSQIAASVAERECATIRRKTDWPADRFRSIKVESPVGPGNVVMIEVDCPNVTELMIGFGKVGVKAEHIARGVLKRARSHVAAGIPVGEYLADQLMLPMGLAAARGERGSFRTGPLSMHSQTHIAVLRRFLPIDITVDADGDSRVVVLSHI